MVQMEVYSVLIARRSTRRMRRSHQLRSARRGISVDDRIKLTCLMVLLLMVLKVCWRLALRYVDWVSL